MSALVGYESSDEEDESVEAEVHPIVEAVGTTADAQVSQSASVTTQASKQGTTRSHQIADGPIVGPTMPDQGANELDGESTSEIQQTMSERDAVRFLTQASHPMTSMPSSPPGSPDPATNARLKRFLDLKAKGVHFNDDLASKSTFRNPSFLATMMARVGLDRQDQYRTSLPHEIWDPLCFPHSAYKEDLLRSQQTIRERDSATKKSLSVSGKRTIEFTSGGNSGENSKDSTPGLSNSKRKRP
ncbi:hypothetical protein A1O3_08525 [Capronia epimyces CBS 606.96]|uniref:HCNGP-like protein n=1 Tax=Capronia epimyces CBS 606.96 TaxID=1182542 RepID=W9Y9G0_9EURO|nr:uncharacterized protein A1O3_08525 [Capronia epimyces CBS 606.96]EXJ79024.1 hypothetical protein A1O3_08525 [Capronia epimyces CBS 606.96]